MILFSYQTFLFERKTAQETKAKLDKHYDKSASLIRPIQKWFGNFQSSHISITDLNIWDSVRATIAENIKKIHAMMKDRRMKVCETADAWST